MVYVCTYKFVFIKPNSHGKCLPCLDVKAVRLIPAFTPKVGTLGVGTLGVGIYSRNTTLTKTLVNTRSVSNKCQISVYIIISRY